MTAPVPNYAHKATFNQGHDGDSFYLNVDFGMNTHGVKLILPLYIRLFGIDTWEIPPGKPSPLDPGYKKGHAAADFTTTVLFAAKKIVCQTIRNDGTPIGQEEYGRWLTRVWIDDQELSDVLRENGHEKVKG